MNNLDKQYQALLQDILDNGVKKQDRTGTGTLSLFGRQIRHKMSDGFPLLTTKKLHWKSIVGELLWFLKGDTNIKWLVDNQINIWNGDAFKNYTNHFAGYEDVPNLDWFINEIKTNDKFANKWGELGPIYGRSWRNWMGEKHMIHPTNQVLATKTIDQIANAIHLLKTNPDDRGIIVSAWNVGELDNMVLRPCHNFFQFFTRELSVKERLFFVNKSDYEYNKSLSNKEQYESIGLDFELALASRMNELNIPTRSISLMYNARSQDVPLGTPFNIASYGLLLEIIAKTMNMIPDELIANMGDCHVYSNQIEPIKEQLTREPFDLPTLKINSGNENWHLLDIDDIVNSLDIEFTFQLENYQSHPSIKIPLSN